MALSIEFDRGLRRPADLAELVEAVVAGQDEDEADWIEWKSTLDLTTPAGTFNRLFEFPRDAGVHAALRVAL